MRNKNIIVFDIGGTWFRSGIYTKDGRLIFISKQPAINYKNTKYTSIKDLQNQFIVYLQKEVKRLKLMLPKEKIQSIGISMGAALNAHNGFIFNSGPLWGPKCLPFNLPKRLMHIFTDMKISIINDVSAALLCEADNKKNKLASKIMLITVSTGIACRIFDSSQKTIPVDKVYGLQGEIGHIPIEFTFEEKTFDLMCDCGGKNHLNAFCSGRGIENILQFIWKKNGTIEKFISAINSNDKTAIKVLDTITKPLAELLLMTFTLDPLIERVILTGGVTHSMKKNYFQSLLSHLNQLGMYQITTRDKKFFEKRVVIGRNDDKSCLIGAALSFSFNS